MTNQRPAMSVNEAASLLAVNERTIRRMIDRGDLRAFRVASVIRISHADFEAACKPVRGGAFD